MVPLVLKSPEAPEWKSCLLLSVNTFPHFVIAVFLLCGHTKPPKLRVQETKPKLVFREREMAVLLSTQSIIENTLFISRRRTHTQVSVWLTLNLFKLIQRNTSVSRQSCSPRRKPHLLRFFQLTVRGWSGPAEGAWWILE